MSAAHQSLTHARWHCKEPVVFVPKRRRKALCGHMRPALGRILHALARQKECRSMDGHLMPDRVHICIAIPPKAALEQVRASIRDQEDADGAGRF
jgi:putative transposase